MKKTGYIIILSIMMFLLSFLIISQVKTVINSNSDIIQLQREDDLRDSILEWKEKYNSTKEQLDVTQTKLNEYMNNISQTDKTIELLQKELKQINIVAGLTDVKGPGITITLNDAIEKNPLFFEEDQIVHDTDIAQIVNELRAAGAEAISVNEQRITNTTAIRCVGPTIKVNDIKIGAPFIIKAIGNSQYLYSGLTMKNGVLDSMQKYGLQVEVTQSENIQIPKYEGAINMKYATIKEED